MGQADAVGVDHHDVDRLREGVVEDRGRSRGWIVGSPPESWQHLGAPFDLDQPVDRCAHAVVEATGARRRGRWRRSTSGSVRLQRRRDLDQADAVCCSCSVQRPQSSGQPLSGSTPNSGGTLPGRLNSIRSVEATSRADEILARRRGSGSACGNRPAALRDDDLGRHGARHSGRGSGSCRGKCGRDVSWLTLATSFGC